MSTLGESLASEQVGAVAVVVVVVPSLTVTPFSPAPASFTTPLMLKHDTSANFVRMYDSVKRLVRAYRKQTDYGNMMQAVRKAMDGVDSISHQDACERISKFTESGLPLHKSAVFPPGVLRWAILESGFEDVGGQKPMYVRGK